MRNANLPKFSSFFQSLLLTKKQNKPFRKTKANNKMLLAQRDFPPSRHWKGSNPSKQKMGPFRPCLPLPSIIWSPTCSSSSQSTLRQTALDTGTSYTRGRAPVNIATPTNTVQLSVTSCTGLASVLLKPGIPENPCKSLKVPLTPQSNPLFPHSDLTSEERGTGVCKPLDGSVFPQTFCPCPSPTSLSPVGSQSPHLSDSTSKESSGPFPEAPDLWLARLRSRYIFCTVEFCVFHHLQRQRDHLFCLHVSVNLNTDPCQEGQPTALLYQKNELLYSLPPPLS